MVKFDNVSVNWNSEIDSLWVCKTENCKTGKYDVVNVVKKVSFFWLELDVVIVGCTRYVPATYMYNQKNNTLV